MEPWGCLVTPHGDDAGVTAQCPTQGAAAMQSAVAAALGCGLHHVQVRSRRVGGGFGGKEYQQCNALAAAAVAARLAGRPVRMVLSRADDMLLKGGRHAFVGTYALGATAAGQIVGMQVRRFTARTAIPRLAGQRPRLVGGIVGFCSHGPVGPLGRQVDLVANGGAWLSSSMGILANAILKGFTTYRLPALKVTSPLR